MSSSHGHNHSHDHDHEHGGSGHHHIPTSFGKAFAIGIGLNLTFVIVETLYGVWSHSLSLLADAGHNFSDVIGLVLAWAAAWLAARQATSDRTYGMKSTTILSALANAILLLVAIGGIAWEAIQRFKTPSPVDGTTVMIVAGVGIVVNTVTALLFMKGRESDLNVRGAFLHMAADALVSLGVVVSGYLMLKTGLTWIDPVVSIAISIVIGVGTYGLLKESFHLAVQGVPKGVDHAKIREFLALQTGVVAVHDLHIWGMSTTENALTAHLIMPSGYPGDAFLKGIANELKESFSIHHSTIQIELDRCEADCSPRRDSLS